MSRVTLMGAMVVIGLVAAAQGAVTTVFECGFEASEGYSVNLLHGQQAWVCSSGAGGEVAVSTADAHGGSQSIVWPFDGTWQGWDFYYHEFALKSNGVLTIEFSYRLEDSVGTGLTDTQHLIVRTGDQQDGSGSYL